VLRADHGWHDPEQYERRFSALARLLGERSPAAAGDKARPALTISRNSRAVLAQAGLGRGPRVGAFEVTALPRREAGLSSPRLCGGSGTPPGSGGVLLFSKLSAGVFPNIAALVAGLDALLSAQPFADPFAPARIATRALRTRSARRSEEPPQPPPRLDLPCRYEWTEEEQREHTPEQEGGLEEGTRNAGAAGGHDRGARSDLAEITPRRRRRRTEGQAGIVDAVLGPALPVTMRRTLPTKEAVAV